MARVISLVLAVLLVVPADAWVATRMRKKKTTVISCAGTAYGGFCWYSGTQGCDTICAAKGGVNAATTNFAGSSGTNANCQGVLNAIGYSGGVSDTSGCTRGTGCGWGAVPSIHLIRCISPATIDSATGGGYAGIYRVCACNQ